MSKLYTASQKYLEAIQQFDKQVLVLDLETTIVDKGNPFAKENYICYVGWQFIDGRKKLPILIQGNKNGTHVNNAIDNLFRGREQDIILVGHNIKFDLHWLRRYGVKTHLLAGVWDTMVGEYLLSGHTNKFPTLEQAAGGSKKVDLVKPMWDIGICTSKIDEDIMEEYLIRDVELTVKAYLTQSINSSKSLIAVQSMATLAIHLMEYNGIHIDTARLSGVQGTAQVQKETAIEELEELIPNLFNPDDWDAIYKSSKTLLSPKLLSTVLFGKPGVKAKVPEIVGKYKNGKPKTKLVEKIMLPTTMLACTPVPDHPYNENTGYSMSEKHIDKITPIDYRGTELLEAVKLYRHAHKLDATYCAPLWKYDTLDTEPVIHHTIHQVSTNTGRTSSANPNMQNQPPEIVPCFKSRYKDGAIYTIDGNQLEVCGLAHVSGTHALEYDLSSGVDIHSKVGSSFFSGKMTKAERRKVKGIVFGLIYGGGEKTLSEQTGLPLKTVRDIIKKFYENYPEIKPWQQDCFEAVKANRKPTGRYLEGYEVHQTKVTSETGRVYTFEEGITPSFITDHIGFSPTQVKNYYVQGWSTADIWMMFIGILRVYLRNLPEEKAQLINVVHDDVWIDIADEETRELIEILVVKVIEQLKEIYNLIFGKRIFVPLKLEMQPLNKGD